jgi:hypothetical protein
MVTDLRAGDVKHKVGGATARSQIPSFLALFALVILIADRGKMKRSTKMWLLVGFVLATAAAVMQLLRTD